MTNIQAGCALGPKPLSSSCMVIEPTNALSSAEVAEHSSDAAIAAPPMVVIRQAMVAISNAPRMLSSSAFLTG